MILKFKKGVQKDFQVTMKDASGTALDLSSYDSGDIVFRMVDKTGTAKVDSTGSFVNDGTDGLVKYDFLAGDVDTEGVYKAYFIFKISGVEKLS